VLYFRGMATEHFHQSQFDLIDTEKLFSLLEGELDARSRRVVADAVAESGGREDLVRRKGTILVPRPIRAAHAVL